MHMLSNIDNYIEINSVLLPLNLHIRVRRSLDIVLLYMLAHLEALSPCSHLYSLHGSISRLSLHFEHFHSPTHEVRLRLESIERLLQCVEDEHVLGFTLCLHLIRVHLLDALQLRQHTVQRLDQRNHGFSVGGSPCVKQNIRGVFEILESTRLNTGGARRDFVSLLAYILILLRFPFIIPIQHVVVLNFSLTLHSPFFLLISTAGPSRSLAGRRHSVVLVFCARPSLSYLHSHTKIRTFQKLM
ncbi:hypothetical protein PMAYCL1PPCAC_24492 [Pristionchus mayeri]|uniref:Uncharacterized protein n=1 Tax=Pristionchus mayeri TaxID=1317129 RepID=A0AAN5I6G4_9BILA|nr:hypothetical protein PMAYCL1PPCAC_24492 [Pristionchus mayeri]